MFKRLINSSVTTVLGWSALARGAQHQWTSSSVPPGPSSTPPSSSDAPDAASSHLNAARRDFIEAVADIGSPQSGDLIKRVHHSRSMRELWFLRTEFFYLVAQHRDQATAKSRLAAIDAHFPRRDARRSTLGNFES